MSMLNFSGSCFNSLAKTVNKEIYNVLGADHELTTDKPHSVYDLRRVARKLGIRMSPVLTTCLRVYQAEEQDALTEFTITLPENILRNQKADLLVTRPRSLPVEKEGYRYLTFDKLPDFIPDSHRPKASLYLCYYCTSASISCYQSFPRRVRPDEIYRSYSFRDIAANVFEETLIFPTLFTVSEYFHSVFLILLIPVFHPQILPLLLLLFLLVLLHVRSTMIVLLVVLDVPLLLLLMLLPLLC
eukprot:g15745.t1